MLSMMPSRMNNYSPSLREQVAKERTGEVTSLETAAKSMEHVRARLTELGELLLGPDCHSLKAGCQIERSLSARRHLRTSEAEVIPSSTIIPPISPQHHIQFSGRPSFRIEEAMLSAAFRRSTSIKSTPSFTLRLSGCICAIV